MVCLRRFLGFNWQERCLLLRTVFVVISLRAALGLLTFRQVNDLLSRRAKRRRTLRNIPKARVIWAVRTASALLPGSTCLTQALAARYQLERCGLNTQLHFGVAKKEDGRLLAHAWLQCDGEAVIGGEIASRFAPVLALN
jgi:hypothetical protein